MTTYSRPVVNGTPTTGQVVKAAHVNEPVDQIYDTILAGGITSDQIAAGAVDTSELATAAVTAAKMDGTLPDTSAMATSAAPTLDAQLANKKYVDDTIGGITLSGSDDSIGEITLGALELKWGSKSIAAATTVTLDFTDEGLSDFTNAMLQGFVCLSTAIGETLVPTADTFAVTGFTIRNNSTSTRTIRYWAVGR